MRIRYIFKNKKKVKKNHFVSAFSILDCGLVSTYGLKGEAEWIDFIPSSFYSILMFIFIRYFDRNTYN